MKNSAKHQTEAFKRNISSGQCGEADLFAKKIRCKSFSSLSFFLLLFQYLIQKNHVLHVLFKKMLCFFPYDRFSLSSGHKFSNLFLNHAAFRVFLVLFFSVFIQLNMPNMPVWALTHDAQWDYMDVYGNRKNLRAQSGHFNINSKVSSANPDTEGIDYDILMDRLDEGGYNFWVMSDLSQNFSIRSFFLLRGAALARLKPNKLFVPGFSWEGDASISHSAKANIIVIGNDSLVYDSSLGQNTSVSDLHKVLDLIYTNFTDADGEEIYTSELDYVNILKNGTYKFANSSYYDEAKTLLDQYIQYWTEEEGVDLNFAMGGEALETMRIDMENRFDEKNVSLKIRESAINFDDLANWIQVQGSTNRYISAAVGWPRGEGDVSAWADDFFREKKNDNTNRFITLVEIKSVESAGGRDFDTTLYKSALENGWRVAPITALDNHHDIPPEAQNYHTGVWAEVETSGAGWPNLLNFLEGLKNRRTFVTSYTGGVARFLVRDNANRTLAVMGGTITADTPGIMTLNIYVDKSQEQITVAKPILVVIYNNGSTRYFPFTSFYNDIYGPGPNDPRIDRVYYRSFDSFKNIRCFYAVADCYRIHQGSAANGQYENNWSYYKLWKYFLLSKLNVERTQIVTAPIFVSVD